MAVLRLMSAGRSSREIGDEMYLSVNTIRWYASQIYSKLGAKNRGEAVEIARESGIL
ncbi:MAG: response regulator transcription factor [Anaerolineae bacterium]|nr:response regulator transcription factor [Anaerolineae bacterium]